MTEAHITIGVVPRERFSAAPEALRRLLQNTPQPFELLIVDAGTPEPWRSDIEQILAYRSDATVVPAPADTGPLLPNQARNLVLEHATGDWICLLENDVLVGEDWLNPLLTNAERHGAGAAVPLILERFDRFEKVHFDDRLHRIIEVRTSSGIKRRIEARPDCKEDDRGGDTRIVDFIETHCMLFTTDALDQVGGFDGEITAQEEIDISFGLHAAGITAVFVPQSTVTFLPPPPVYPSERAYYHAKWNPETYQNDRRRMQERWGIVGYPSATGVVESRRAMAEGSIQDQIQAELDQRSFLDATREDLAPLLDRGRLILVHDD
ncbi:MAG: glycosyltransferase family 2 protein, partial [Acidimicrobiales bacterium]